MDISPSNNYVVKGEMKKENNDNKECREKLEQLIK